MLDDIKEIATKKIESHGFVRTQQAGTQKGSELNPMYSSVKCPTVTTFGVSEARGIEAHTGQLFM